MKQQLGPKATAQAIKMEQLGAVLEELIREVEQARLHHARLFMAADPGPNPDPTHVDPGTAVGVARLAYRSAMERRHNAQCALTDAENNFMRAFQEENIPKLHSFYEAERAKRNLAVTGLWKALAGNTNVFKAYPKP